MSNINPIGVDQSSGQLKPIGPADNIVNNLGQQITIGSIYVGDYSGGSNITSLVYSWGSAQLLPAPSTIPTNGAIKTSWSADGEFLVAPSFDARGMVYYQRVGDAFYILANPSTVTAGGTAAAWSSNGQFLALTGTPPILNVYQRSGTTLTRLNDPASNPLTGNAIGCAWSPNGEYLSITSNNSPNSAIFRRDGTTLTFLTTPSSIPGPSNVQGTAWSPDGQFLAIGGTNAGSVYQVTGINQFTWIAGLASGYSISWSPSGQYIVTTNASNMSVYRRSGTSFTAISNPSSLPGAIRGVAWHPSGNYLVTTANGTFAVYSFNQTTEVFTLLASPASVSTGDTYAPSWSNDGQYLTMMAGSGSPVIHTYKTGNSLPSNGVVTTFANS